MKKSLKFLLIVKDMSPTYQDNLIKGVNEADFVMDLTSAGGNPLKKQFRAIHSSLAMAVNNFAPFRNRLGNLSLPVGENYKNLKFEQQCPLWYDNNVGKPQIDVLIERNTEVIAIESKLLEFLNGFKKCFAENYFKKLNYEQENSKYFQEMLEIQSKAMSYKRLNTTQLIKHAFGLINTFPERPVTLIYLYWEPLNVEELPKDWKDVFYEHRREIETFKTRIRGSKPTFMAMSYSELWRLWGQNASPWLQDHLNEVKSRYCVSILE